MDCKRRTDECVDSRRDATRPRDAAGTVGQLRVQRGVRLCDDAWTVAPLGTAGTQTGRGRREGDGRRPRRLGLSLRSAKGGSEGLHRRTNSGSGRLSGRVARVFATGGGWCRSAKGCGDVGFSRSPSPCVSGRRRVYSPPRASSRNLTPDHVCEAVTDVGLRVTVTSARRRSPASCAAASVAASACARTERCTPLVPAEHEGDSASRQVPGEFLAGASRNTLARCQVR